MSASYAIRCCRGLLWCSRRLRCITLLECWTVITVILVLAFFIAWECSNMLCFLPTNVTQLLLLFRTIASKASLYIIISSKNDNIKRNLIISLPCSSKTSCTKPDISGKGRGASAADVILITYTYPKTEASGGTYSCCRRSWRPWWMGWGTRVWLLDWNTFTPPIFTTLIYLTSFVSILWGNFLVT